jgi:hypothetical protein
VGAKGAMGRRREYLDLVRRGRRSVHLDSRSSTQTLTSVTARGATGSDMALAFVAHLSNEATADFIAGMMEITRAKESDDPFAAVHGLL